MRKLDRRIIRTRKALGDALIQLSLEKGYDNFTIRDLTERADVGYATFYRHFRTKDELATFCLLATSAEFMSAVQSAETLHEESLALFNALDKHRDACLFGLSLPRDHPALKPVWEEIMQWMMGLYSARDGETIPLEVSLNHLINSCVELFRWWLTDGEDYSIEQMAIMQDELVVKLTETVALDHRMKPSRNSVPELAGSPPQDDTSASEDA